ncbi:MAG: hypothetical protein HKUEN01_15120 [Candidatus Kuenenia stuttgartiensis]|uniref:Macro domain-containing protein n=1 Tax=Kuenenia stuttgartiensis TaxID=174633 RepID=A0A2C9CC80_KUEST|nr:hypothetical protein [Candidatus Kuenenia stuttgartiensis]GJQ49126.1 MAG: hypothetical protein HKUEN01_15120 [Candidatus Kuenenia stuttgartiensis]SOH03290.1 hypothetical protein KSMBR1_0779 [Candidatus Kuenenia stuttgartiensis]
MITYIIGNLFESPAHVLINTVNTGRVMGKGIAKDFKTIYPEMFREYLRWHSQNQTSKKSETNSKILPLTPSKGGECPLLAGMQRVDSY